MFLFYIFIIILLHFCQANNEGCTTPNGEDGFCKPISQCKPLADLFTFKLKLKVGLVLRRYHCGFDGTIPKVCCPKTNLFDSSTCGYQPIQNKIIGGNNTGIDEFPWMALLFYTNDSSTYYDCGGTLISKRYVLTAAHCIKSNLVVVRLGEYNVNTTEDCLKDDCALPVQDIAIEEKIKHEEYLDDHNKYHDIGLLRLAADANFNDFVRPICLPNVEDMLKNYTGSHHWVSGWGYLHNNRTLSLIKQKLQLPVRNNLYCQEMSDRYYLNVKFQSTQICAGGESGKDACKGDSGGPLMTMKIDSEKNEQWYITGIVSFGLPICGMPGFAGGFTRVSEYLDWITIHTRD